MSSLADHTDLERAVENGGNLKNVENSSYEVVIDKLQPDFEAGSSGKEQVGDCSTVGAVYPSGVGLGSCEQAVAWSVAEVAELEEMVNEQLMTEFGVHFGVVLG